MIAAIYSRKSKYTGKGESIGNQVQLCKEYASNQLKNKSITNFLIYEDEGFSGGNTNRPEFQKLLEDAKLKKYHILICYRLDRISRNVADFSSTLELLQNYAIDFISIREQFDTTSPMGRAMIYIASVFAQLERETIAERIKDNMLELSKTGRWLGGTTPIGYYSEPITYIDENMKERKLFKLKQVPEELKIVSLIYKKYLELNSLSKVETYTLQNNIKTKRGANFTRANIRIILTNPVYVKSNDEVLAFLEGEGITTCGVADGEHGLLTYNKSKSKTTNSGKTSRVLREKSEWIAAMSSQKGIIEPEDWIAVQKTLYKNKDRFPNEGKTHHALLTGKIMCAKCGSKMQIAHGHTSAITGETLYYYACSMKKHSKGTRCNNKNAKVAEIDGIVIEELKKLCKEKNRIISELIKLKKVDKESDFNLNKEVSIKTSITNKEKQIDNLVNRLSLSDDIEDLLVSKIRVLKNEIASLNQDLENITINKTKSDVNQIGLSFIEMLMNSYSIIDSFTLDEKKLLIETLIDTIMWNGDDYSLEINFIG